MALRAWAAAAVLLLSGGCGLGDGALGERIYREGAGADGRLAYREGPAWLQRAGRGCAVCHGDRGEGRFVQAGAAAGAAPPLTASVLAARGYDAAALRRAITEGIDPAGRGLSYYMPRWVLSEQEVAALLRHLATL